MSLVVAGIHADRVSFVADTKVLSSDGAGRIQEGPPMLKLAILRGDLAVGVTGDMPRYVLSQLVERRAAPVPDLLDWMTTIPYAGFVVASLDPAPQLWKVGDGRVEDRTSVGWAWAGDSASYEHFQARYHEWPDGESLEFRLMSSMQWLLSFSPVRSVGGGLTRIATTAEGFRFAADPMAVVGYPSLVVLPMPGRPPLTGALAYYLPQRGLALLFRHEEPWQPVTITARSVDEVIDRAADHHQALSNSAHGLPPEWRDLLAESSP